MKVSHSPNLRYGFAALGSGAKEESAGLVSHFCFEKASSLHRVGQDLGNEPKRRPQSPDVVGNNPGVVKPGSALVQIRPLPKAEVARGKRQDVVESSTDGSQENLDRLVVTRRMMKVDSGRPHSTKNGFVACYPAARRDRLGLPASVLRDIRQP